MVRKIKYFFFKKQKKKLHKKIFCITYRSVSIEKKILFDVVEVYYFELKKVNLTFFETILQP